MIKIQTKEDENMKCQSCGGFCEDINHISAERDDYSGLSSSLYLCNKCLERLGNAIPKETQLTDLQKELNNDVGDLIGMREFTRLVSEGDITSDDGHGRLYLVSDGSEVQADEFQLAEELDESEYKKYVVVWFNN